MVDIYQLVQEISWVQEFVTLTLMPTPTGSALKPIIMIIKYTLFYVAICDKYLHVLDTVDKDDHCHSGEMFAELPSTM